MCSCLFVALRGHARAGTEHEEGGGSEAGRRVRGLLRRMGRKEGAGFAVGVSKVFLRAEDAEWLFHARECVLKTAASVLARLAKARLSAALYAHARVCSSLLQGAARRAVGEGQWQVRAASSLRVCYAMSGTEIAYGAGRRRGRRRLDCRRHSAGPRLSLRDARYSHTVGRPYLLRSVRYWHGIRDVRYFHNVGCPYSLRGVRYWHSVRVARYFHTVLRYGGVHRTHSMGH
eukprot:1102405-Rhodomonas_salina.1